MSRKLNKFQQSIKELGDYTNVATARVIKDACVALDINPRARSKEDEARIYAHIEGSIRMASVKAVNSNMMEKVITSTSGDNQEPETITGAVESTEVAAITASPGTFNLTMKSKFDEIGEAGKMYQRESVASIFGFAKCVELVHKKCDKISGGTNFTKETFRLWRIDRTTSHVWVRLAEARTLQEFAAALPVALTTLKELTLIEQDRIPDLVESGDINPNLTTKEAKALHTTTGNKPKPAPTLGDLQQKLERLEKEVARLKLAIENWQE